MMFFFGCEDRPGHFLIDQTGRNYHGRFDDANFPCPLSAGQLDCVFAPRGVREREDVAELTHVHGWTVLAMWDRSVDRRPGSNAAFIAKGTQTAEMMWNAANQVFPRIAGRLKASPFASSFHPPQTATKESA